VVTANRAFYQMFKVTPDETIGRNFYELGNHQWDIPDLRELLAETGRGGDPVVNIEVEHDFQDGGKRVMILNARRLQDSANNQPMVLLAIQDVTQQRRIMKMLTLSHQRLRALLQRLEMVREEERTRIAREVHDRLGQELTAIKTGLAMLDKKIRGSQDPPWNWLERLGFLSEATDAGIESVRHISVELRPSALDQLGLGDAIAHELEQFEDRTGIACRFSCGADVALTPERTTAMFRIFQEALINVERHAQARHVHVKLYKADGQVRLEIIDNGVGIPDEHLEGTNTLGLLGMMERASACDGIVEIKGMAGKGTRVIVSFPAEERRAKQ
jgi:PAS domain S-box-containing protein